MGTKPNLNPSPFSNFIHPFYLLFPFSGVVPPFSILHFTNIQSYAHIVLCLTEMKVEMQG